MPDSQIIVISEISEVVVIESPDAVEFVEIPSERIEIVEVGIQGPRGATGAKGADGTASRFVYLQSQPLDEWIVNHNLGGIPLAQVFSSGGSLIDADVLHVSENQLRVYFSAPAAGQVRCI